MEICLQLTALSLCNPAPGLLLAVQCCASSDIFYDPESQGYYPVVFPNDFWLLRDKLIMVNETVSNLTLSLVVETLPAWRWQIYMSSEQSFKLQESYGATLEGEADELKVRRRLARLNHALECHLLQV